jgi:hypothetical protein
MERQEKFALGLCVLLSFCTSYYFFALLLPVSRAGMEARNLGGGFGYGNDFYQIWATSRHLLERDADPYGPEMQREIEIGLYGRTLDRANRGDASVPYRGYAYPLQANLLTQPLAYLSFRGVQWTLSFVLPLCALAGVLLWTYAFGQDFAGWTRVALCVIAMSSFPVLEGIYALQPTLMVAAIVGGTVVLLQKNRMAWAGILLAMGAIKPHLIGLFALWLMFWAIGDWPRRKAFLVAFISTSAAMFVLTLLWYPAWWRGWLHSLPAYRQINTPPLAEFIFGKVAGTAVEVGCIVIGAVAVWRWRRAEPGSSEFLLVSSYLLATSMIATSSGVAVYDQFLLLPAILWLWSERHLLLRADRLVRVVVLILLATLFWPWVTSAILTALAFLLPWARSYRAVLFPLATAATFPIALSMLLTIFIWRMLLRARRADRTGPSHRANVI